MAKKTPTQKRFYYAADANSRHEANGIHISFRRVIFSSGTWAGIYATDDPEKQEVLKLLEEKNGLVNEIDEQTYQYYLANMDDSPMRTADKQPRMQQMIPGAPPQLPEPEVQNVELELTDKATSDTEKKKEPRRARTATSKKGIDPRAKDDSSIDDDETI